MSGEGFWRELQYSKLEHKRTPRKNLPDLRMERPVLYLLSGYLEKVPYFWHCGIRNWSRNICLEQLDRWILNYFTDIMASQDQVNVFLDVIENIWEMTPIADRPEQPLGQRCDMNSLKRSWMEMQTSQKMSAWRVISVRTRKDSVNRCQSRIRYIP